MKKLRFLISLHSCENDFQVAQAQCAQDTASKLGLDALWVREKLLTATIYISPLTGKAMEILVAAIQNGTQPPEHSLTTSVSIPALDALIPRKT